MTQTFISPSLKSRFYRQETLLVIMAAAEDGFTFLCVYFSQADMVISFF